MKLAVLGAGIQAKAIVDDFVRHSGADAIAVADIDGGRAERLAAWAGDARVKGRGLDVTDAGAVVDWLRDVDAVVSAVPYRHNVALARCAVESRTHFTDLGGNNDVVARELELDADAKAAGVTIVPDLGLAPGMVPLLGAGIVRSLGAPRTLHIRVGGLPQSPKPPLNYRLFFAVQGLINEYVEPCRVIRNGRVEIVPGLSELEELAFPKPFGVLEAFQTSGGTSTLIETLAGEVDELTYKTIRYPGHCEEMRLLQALGLFAKEPVTIDGAHVSPRAFTEAMLVERLSEPTPDVVLGRIVATGTEEGEAVRIVEELVDYPDEERGISAMARCTGYPAAIITAMLGRGDIAQPGAIPQENAVPIDAFRAELEKRDIVFTRRVQHADGTPA